MRKGTLLVEDVGKNLTAEDSDRIYDDTNVKNHHTFLFSVDKWKVIDATHGGNEARFINHSCDPNCDAIIEKRRVYIEANRTIRKGEELAYDYNYERTPKTTKKDERLYRCLCGADSCRGTILSAKLTVPQKKAGNKATQGAAKEQAKQHEQETRAARGPARWRCSAKTPSPNARPRTNCAPPRRKPRARCSS